MFEWFTNPDIWEGFRFWILKNGVVGSNELWLPFGVVCLIMYSIETGIFKWDPVWAMCSFMPIGFLVAYFFVFAPIALVSYLLAIYLIYVLGKFLRGLGNE